MSEDYAALYETDTCSVFDEDCELDVNEAAPEVSLAPALLVPAKKGDLLASTYNRIGGAITAAASQHGLDPALALAIFVTESGPFHHVPGKAIIRFENHLLWRLWGEKNRAMFGRLFRFGNPPWKGHELFHGQAWKSLHTSQALEYAALFEATALAGEDTALRCISIGGPQILCRNFALCGYASPKEMYDDFQGSEGAHVRAFFAFCAAQPKLYEAMKVGDTRLVARYYNGPGQVDAYAPKIESRWRAAQAFFSA